MLHATPKNVAHPCGRSSRILPDLALFFITCIAFLPACFNQYIWDDGPHISDNVHLRTLGGIVDIWTQPFSLPQYYPIFHSVLWIEFRFWGLHAWGYHVASIVVHAASALLLLRLLQKLNVPFAWFIAALFAVHPVQVESVAWAMEFKTVLSGFLYFLALLVLLPCWNLTEYEVAAPRRRRLYLVGMLLFILSLLSKSVTATLPAVILLLVWWRRGKIAWRDVGRAVPLFAVGMLSGAFTALLERTRVGADGPEWDIPFLHRVLIAGRSLCVYAEKLLWPHPLAFFYHRWIVNSSSLVQWLFPAAVIVLAIVLWAAKERIGRGFLTALLFFIGTLFPALGFVNVYPMRFSFVADHFQYLAAIGVFAIVAGILAAVHRRVRSRRLVPVLCGIILGTLCTLSFLRCRVFFDDYTLFQDDVRAEPDSWAAHTFFCTECLIHGQSLAALDHAALGVSLNPTDIDGRESLVYVLGMVGDSTHAGRIMNLPRRLSPADPHLLAALASAFSDARDPERADLFFCRVLSLEPTLSDAQFDYAIFLNAHGRSAEALALLNNAIVMHPDQQRFRDEVRQLESRSATRRAGEKALR